MTQVTQEPGLLSQIQAGVVPWTTLAGVLLAVLFGVFFLVGMGLAGPEVLHNAAHDVRHGLSFPCH